MTSLAHRLTEALGPWGGIPHRVLIEVTANGGVVRNRVWRSADPFTEAEVAERVRWQLDAWIGLPRGSDQELTGGVVLVRLVPDEVSADDGMQLGLWGGQSEADRRAARAHWQRVRLATRPGAALS